MQQQRSLRLPLVAPASKATVWSVLRFMPKWRTVLVALSFVVAFCLGGVCGILVERKEALRLQTLFFQKQKKMMAVAKATVKANVGAEWDVGTPASQGKPQWDEGEQWEEVNVRGNDDPKVDVNCSFAEFSVEWSKYNEQKRANKLLQVSSP